MRHEYTIADFSIDNYEKAMVETGKWSDTENKYSVNYSSILTCLIQNTGRFVEHYASDLFIDWMQIEKYLSEYHYIGECKTYLFGLRESGVDHDTFVLSRYNNDSYSIDYRKLFILQIEFSEEDYCTMTFGKCHVKYYPKW